MKPSFGCVAALLCATSSISLPAQADEQVTGVETVVVTAERRAENAIDVPASLSALQASDLENLGIRSVDQLAAVVPGLNFSNTGPIPVFGIRGITLNDYGLSNESPIATYVDDVYMGSPNSATTQMFDVDHVEVLRGPQGTLFGRNATGGLVQIISKKPTDQLAADLSLQYGSFNQFIATGGIGGPVTDGLRLRAAFNFNRDDGWQKNVVTGTRQARTNEWAMRLIADADITSQLLSEINFHMADQANSTPGYYNRGLFDPETFDPCPVSQVLANLCVSPFGSRNPDPRPGTVYSDIAYPPNDFRSHGVSETLTYTSDSYTITSISAYEYGNKYYMEDSDGSPDPLIQSDAFAKRTQYSQEVRINGSSDVLNWVAGVFYYYEKTEDAGGSLLQIVPEYGTYGNQNQYFASTHSTALFGQVDYEIMPDLTATAGFRYSWELKKLTITDDFSAPTYIDYDRASTAHPTLKVGLNWRFEPGWMAYGSITTGFKSPAFDTSLVLQGGAIAAQPETDTNYEIGIKGQAFDNRLQLSSAFFYLRYKNFQLITIPPDTGNATSELLNADGANIYGIDAEVTAVPVDGLTLHLSGTWLHTRINSPGLFIGPHPLDGAQLAYSPDFSVKGFARYDIALPDSWVVSPHLDFTFNNTSQSQPVLDPFTQLKAYTVLNVGMEFTPPGTFFTVDIFVNNLTNTEYFNYAGDFAGYNILQWSKPRIWGVRLSAKL